MGLYNYSFYKNILWWRWRHQWFKGTNFKFLKEIFDTLISAFNKTKNIKKVNFSSINKVFINSKIDKRIIKNKEELISILKKNSKLDPFFHKMTSEIKREKNMILSKENKNIGNLCDVIYKIYHYYNEKGEIKKSISKPISKKFIKQVEKTNMLESSKKIVGLHKK